MPYEIISKIASGTFGTVYKVQNSTNGEFFALKLIHENYKTPKELKRIRRGFETAQKVSHPNCVKMIEWYEKGNDIGFVMEFVETIDVLTQSEAINGNSKSESLTKSQNLTDKISKIIQIANGLEALHQNGIIHRDLKPANILTAKDGQIKITDFDFVKLDDASTYTHSHSFLGTVKYSSPEQCKDSSKIDHRSDLYSLGVIFYRMLTGKVPFDSESVTNVILGHIRTPLISPTQFNPNIPAEIENIILKLLQKNPKDRFKSAKEVIYELHKFQANPTKSKIEKSSDFLLYPRFTGRLKEFSNLENAFSNSSKNKPQFIFIGGDSGSGKTQLWKEFAEGLPPKETIYLKTKCVENCTSLEPLKEILVQSLNFLKGFSDSEKCQFLGKFGRDLELILPELSKQPFFEKLPIIPRLSQNDKLFRLFGAFCEFLKNLKKDKILVLFFDDLQWSDSETLKFLQFIQNNFKNEKLFLSGTFRDKNLPSTNFTTILENYDQIILKALELNQVKQILNSMLGQAEPVETKFAELILEKTQGNPLFIKEVMFHLLEKGKIYKSQNKWVLSNEEIISEEFPSSIHSTIAQRMDLLPSKIKEILQIASVIGNNFSFELLKSLLPKFKETELQASLLKACEENYLKVQEKDYEFYHDSVRETLEKQINENEKTRLHKIIADFFESKFTGKEDELILKLATHFFGANSKVKAKKFSLLASDVARKKWALSNSVKFLSQAIELEKNTKKHIDLLIRKGELLREFGKLMEAISLVENSHQIALETGEEKLIAKTLLAFGNEQIQNFQLDKGFKKLTESLEFFEKFGDTQKVAEANFRLGQFYTMKREHQKSLEYCKNALNVFERISNSRMTMEISYNIAVNYQGLGDFKNAISYVNQCSKIAEKLDDRIEFLYFESSKATLYRNIGETNKSLNLFEKILKSAEEIGFKNGIITTSIGISNIYFGRKQFSKSISYLLKGIRVSEEINDKFSLLSANNNISFIYYLLGDFDKSNLHIENSYELNKGINRDSANAIYFKLKGLYKFSQNRFQEAIEHFDKSIYYRKNDSSTADIIYLKAKTFFELGNFEKAQKINDEAIKFDEQFKSDKVQFDTKILSLKINFHLGLQKKSLVGLLDLINSEKDKNRIAELKFEFCTLYSKNENLTLLPGKKIDFENFKLRTIELHKELIENDESFELKERVKKLEKISNSSGIFQSNFLKSLIPVMEPEMVLGELIEFITQETKSDSCQIILKNSFGKLEPLAISTDFQDKEIQFSKSILLRALENQNVILVKNALESEEFKTNESIVGKIFLSVMAFPLTFENKIIGALYLDRKNPENGVYSEQDLKNISSLVKVLIPILQKQNQNLKLKIQSQIKELGIFIGNSPKMQKVYESIENASQFNFPVYIFGETGTGKELVAEALHKLSPRREKPFITINCAAIPKDLAESELFGHKKGAFTGAISDKKGKFELANGGTLLLDEVGELTLENQAKLLRVIQNKQFWTIGSEKPQKVDVKLLVATNKDLEEEVKNGNFREDLLHRLDVLKITIPPLRERKEDIPFLAYHFLQKFNLESGKEIKGFANEIFSAFEKYDWKGNVRELENRIIKALVKQKNDNSLTLNDFDFLKQSENASSPQIKISDSSKLLSEDLIELVDKLDGKTIHEKMATVEKAIILKTLNECDWNKTKVSEKLGISRMQINRIIARFNIKK